MNPIKDPLRFMSEKFDRVLDSHGANRITSSIFDAKAIYSDLFSNSTTYSSSDVPLMCTSYVSTTTTPINQLVRYRGLIQDMSNPEYYIGCTRSRNTESSVLKYREEHESILDEHDPILFERLPTYCVPLPGENSWLHGCSPNNINPGLSSPGLVCFGGECDSFEKKRVFSSTNSGNAAEESKGSVGCDVCCVVKFYDQDTTENGRGVRLHDMVELLGVYTTPPVVSEDCTGCHVCEALSESQRGTLRGKRQKTGPPITSTEGEVMDILELWDTPLDSSAGGCTGAVIHCIAYRVLGPSFPLLSTPSTLFPDSSYTNLALPASLSSQATAASRLSVVNLLTSALDGDSLAARFIVLALLSRVHNRQSNPSSVAVGTLPINIYNFSASEPALRRVIEAMRSFVPRLVEVEVTVDTLNSGVFNVHKNEASNRINPSPLQVGVGTVLVLNECNLQCGELNATGVKGVESLQRIILNQKMPVSFPYCALDIPTEISVIILSDKPSIIATSNTVKIGLSPGNNSTDVSEDGHISDINLADGDRRIWWMSCMDVSVVTMEESVISTVEDFFVRHRENSNMSAEALHQLLAMARLEAVGYGSSTITLHHWEQVEALETLRSQREMSR